MQYLSIDKTCNFSLFFREQIIKQLQDENNVRNKYYRQLEVITQKINSIPVPSSVKQVSAHNYFCHLYIC